MHVSRIETHHAKEINNFKMHCAVFKFIKLQEHERNRGEIIKLARMYHIRLENLEENLKRQELWGKSCQFC